MNTCRAGRARGLSLVGLLVTMACIFVLMFILLRGLGKAYDGEGTMQPGTVASHLDRESLRMLQQSLFLYATEHKGRYPIPSEIAQSDDWSLNTTANTYSAMIAQGYARPEMLVSRNDRNYRVEVDEDYEFSSWNPSLGTFWDTRFRADLADVSNVSYAHLPLFGERFHRYWMRSTMDSRIPICGNRGPQDGKSVLSSNTMTGGRWAGHFVFADGHVDYFEQTFTPNGLVYGSRGESFPDNVFRVDDGPAGVDVVITFTRVLSEREFELQWD